MFHHISTHLGFRCKYQKQKVPVSCSIVGWNILPLAYIHKYEFMHDIYIYVYIYTNILYIYIYIHWSILVHILYRDVCVVFLRFDFPWLGDFSFGRPVLQVVAERHDLPLTSLVDAAQAWQKWSEKKKKKNTSFQFVNFWVCLRCDVHLNHYHHQPLGGGGQKLMSFFFFHVVVFY